MGENEKIERRKKQRKLAQHYDLLSLPPPAPSAPSLLPLTVTTAVDVPPCPSEIVYMKEVLPLKVAFGVKLTCVALAKETEPADG
jgi:hypothetical protein